MSTLLPGRLHLDRTFCFRLIAFVPFVTAACFAQWNHDPNALVGPQEWGQVSAKYATCGTEQNPVGHHQSPINIITSEAVPYSLPPIELDYQRLRPEKEGHESAKETQEDARASNLALADDHEAKESKEAPQKSHEASKETKETKEVKKEAKEAKEAPKKGHEAAAKEAPEAPKKAAKETHEAPKKSRPPVKAARAAPKRRPAVREEEKEEPEEEEHEAVKEARKGQRETHESHESVKESREPVAEEHEAAKPVEIDNNGHTIEVSYPAGSFLRILEMGKSASQRARRVDAYGLVQFHFHAPSEHTINGKRYDLEMHLVHRNAAGELAVVGLLFAKGERRSVIDELILAAPTASGAHKEIADTYDIRSALPKNLSYFTYSGSLTTPPCSEGVRWIVLKQTMEISQQALNRLHKIVGQFAGYHGFADNNRPTLPLNDRKVLTTP